MSIYSVFGPRVPLYADSSSEGASNSTSSSAYDPLSFLTEQQSDEAQDPTSTMDLNNLYPRPRVPPPKSSARGSAGDVLHRAGSVRKPPAPASAIHLAAEPTTPDLPSSDAGKADFKDGVKAASLEIIPLLLASPPSIPPALKSAELKQRHSFLSISPYDVEDYLVTAGPSHRRDVAKEAITNLDTLKAHVDQLAGIVATETSALTTIIRSIKFLSPEKGQLMASVDLGEYDSDPGLVSMVLKGETYDGNIEHGKKVDWRFHNLLPCGASRGAWIESAEQTLSQHLPTRQESTIGERESPALGSSDKTLQHVRSGTSIGTSRTGDTFKTAIDRQTSHAADEEDDEDEESKQQHFTEAEDFWGGWDDGDGPGQTAENGGAASRDDEADAAKAEDDYWNSYDAQDPYDESQKRYAQEMQKQHQADLDTASQVGSVHFDNLERLARQDEISSEGMPGDYFGPEAVEQTRGQSHRGVGRNVGTASIVDESIPEEGSLVNDEHPVSRIGERDTIEEPTYHGINALSNLGSVRSADAAHQAAHSTAAGSLSPRSDSTDLGGDEDDDGYTTTHDTADDGFSHDITTVEGTDDGGFRRTESTKVPESNTNDATAGHSERQRDSRLGLKSTTAEDESSDFADPAAEREHQNINLGINRQSDGGADTSRKAVDASEDRDPSTLSPQEAAQSPSTARQPRMQSRAIPFAYHPPPMSVTGQSTFETPEDMTLADLEAFYRGREQQRMIETRERISRLHRPLAENDNDSTTRQHGEEEDDDDEEGEANSAINEARSALGDVVPDYTGLPGFGPSESAQHQRKQEERRHDEHASQPDHSESHERRSSVDRHTSRGPKSDADPIEALAQADPSIVLNAGDEEQDRLRQHPLPSNNVVSMDTLRRLAEENRLSGPGVTAPRRGDPEKSEATSNSGKSKSGGFKNFLQLAPSTVFTDAELEEQPDDEYVPPPPPSEAARPPSVVPEDDEQEAAEDSYETQRPPNHQDASHEGSGGPPSDNFSVQEERSDGTAPHEEEDADVGEEQNQPHKEEPEPSPREERPEESSQGSKHKDKDSQEDFDFNAFMFPLQAAEERRKGARLDSPGLSDTDPAAKEAFDMITGQRRNARDKDTEDASAQNNYSASETFLPGAASDASVRLLPGSVIQRMHQRDSETDIHNIQEEAEPEEVSKKTGNRDSHSTKPSADQRRPSQKPNQWQGSSEDVTKGLAVNSTSTELGLAEIEDETTTSQGKHSVVPGPQWRGAAPPPGSTSQHTANLRHEYLKWQRQQAMQTQRNRIQQQRAQGGLFSDDRTDNSHVVNVNAEDVPAPLARGAEQRAPFPGKKGGDGESRRPNPVRQNTVSDHPATSRARPWGARKDSERQEGHNEDGADENLNVPQRQGGASASSPAPPSPVDPAAQTEYSPSPANATWNVSRKQEPNLEGISDIQPPATPKDDPRKQLHVRQQEARAQAGSAANRRREILKRVSQRNEHAKNLLKSFINIVNGGESPMAENDFMRLAREAFRECTRDNEALIANGAGGRRARPPPGPRLPSSGLGKSAALQGNDHGEDGEIDDSRGEPAQAIPDITLNGGDHMNGE